jgi:ribosome modulation factor
MKLRPKDLLTYQKEYDQGVSAYILGDFEDQCPYGMRELGKRCAWLGGWHDQHVNENGRGAERPSRSDGY